MEVLGKLQNSDDATKRICSLLKESIKSLSLFKVELRKISSNHFVMQLSEWKFLVVGKQNPPKLTSTFLEP